MLLYLHRLYSVNDIRFVTPPSPHRMLYHSRFSGVCLCAGIVYVSPSSVPQIVHAELTEAIGQRVSTQAQRLRQHYCDRREYGNVGHT